MCLCFFFTSIWKHRVHVTNVLCAGIQTVTRIWTIFYAQIFINSRIYGMFRYLFIVCKHFFFQFYSIWVFIFQWKKCVCVFECIIILLFTCLNSYYLNRSTNIFQINLSVEMTAYWEIVLNCQYNWLIENIYIFSISNILCDINAWYDLLDCKFIMCLEFVSFDRRKKYAVVMGTN